MLTVERALVATAVFSAIILATRAFPFALFSKREPPALLRFIERFIPSAVMAILVVYCLKDIAWTTWPSGVRELAGIALVAILHIWKKNAMLSIFGGTAFYMLLLSAIR